MLLTIDEKYRIGIEKVKGVDSCKITPLQYFLSDKEVKENPSGYLREGEHQVIAKLRRIKLVEDLAKLGLLLGSPAPEFAYYIIAGQPSAFDFPETLYYEIRHTFEDMGWEYTGCPLDSCD
ncbi:hypothetical protein [Microbulbifer variabilis]|uniref:hypothetical protein n=1 Tax=Microbulbifer variabilis TaxID=266805 RepID=UPI001CFCFBEE|nr:hypothetical protein [Microbulbifer variabilis]